MFVECKDGRLINVNFIELVEIRENYRHTDRHKIWAVKARIRDTFYTICEDESLDECIEYRDRIFERLDVI